MGLGPARSQRLAPLLLHLPSLATVLVVVENLNEVPCGFWFGWGWGGRLSPQFLGNILWNLWA